MTQCPLVRIVRVRPSQRFPTYWEACEGKDVQPAFHARSDAITYAKGQFAGQGGEIHVYDDNGEDILDKIVIDERTQCPQAD